MSKIKLKVDSLEYGMLVNGLVELRNKLLREKEDTEPVDEVLLKAIDAPEKKRPFSRCLTKDERGYF